MGLREYDLAAEDEPDSLAVAKRTDVPCPTPIRRTAFRYSGSHERAQRASRLRARKQTRMVKSLARSSCTHFLRTKFASRTF